MHDAQGDERGDVCERSESNLRETQSCDRRARLYYEPPEHESTRWSTIGVGVERGGCGVCYEQGARRSEGTRSTHKKWSDPRAGQQEGLSAQQESPWCTMRLAWATSRDTKTKSSAAPAMWVARSRRFTRARPHPSISSDMNGKMTRSQERVRPRQKSGHQTLASPLKRRGYARNTRATSRTDATRGAHAHGS